MNPEHFGGGEGRKDEKRETDIPVGHELPATQELPVELPHDKKRRPDGIENWPDIGQLDEDDPLPGESGGKKRPPTLH
jgi:hypothetical protein